MNQTLLRDLAQYKTHKEKGVMNAARGIIAVYRTANPLLLSRKDRVRGLPCNETYNTKARGVQTTTADYTYGNVKVHTGVEVNNVQFLKVSLQYSGH